MNLNLSETIKRLRREKEWTQEELATSLGVSFQAVSRWENAQSYPDIEFLPKLAALFGVSMDALFGMDAQNIGDKKREYEEALTDDTDFDIELTKKYMDEFPREPYFQYRLMALYQFKGFSFTKTKLSEMRRLCRFVIENVTDYEEEWMRSLAVAYMIKVEDEDHVDEWLKILDNRAMITSKRAMIDRYYYRSEVKLYNIAIQNDIVLHLEDIFSQDFCKRDEKTFKNAASRAEGQKAILKIIDVLRDPATDLDAWLPTRAFAYLRLAGGEFGSGNKEAGYEALERAIDLYLLYAEVPIGTRLTYHCPSLDEMGLQKIHACDEILDTPYRGLTVIKGWEWFNSVRKEERYLAQIERIEAYLQDHHFNISK